MDVPPLKDTYDLRELVKAAMARVDAMTPEQRKAMWEAQRQSWLRSIEPCEHGVRDWEQCEECRANARDAPTAF